MLMRPNWFPRPGTIPAPNALLHPTGRRQALATRKSCLLPNSLKRPKISAGAVARLRAAPIFRTALPSPARLTPCHPLLAPHILPPSPPQGDKHPDAPAVMLEPLGGEGGQQQGRVRVGFKPHPGILTRRRQGMLLAHPATQTSPRRGGPNHEQLQQILARAPSRTTCPAWRTELEREK